MKILRVKSDNFEGLMLADAYKELTLQMSTGDFHVHRAKIATIAMPNEPVYAFDTEENEFYEYGYFSDACHWQSF